MQVLLAATSNQSQTSGASGSRQTTSPVGPQSYDFRTTGPSHESGQQQALEGSHFSDVITPSQNIDLSLLQAPADHSNRIDFDPVPFAQSFDGIDSAHWLLEDDFDISVFDNLFSFHTPNLDNALGPDIDQQSIVPQRAPPVVRRSMPKILDLRHQWYTHVPLMASCFAASSRPMTPGDSREDHAEDIDESYRAKLAVKLRPPQRDEPLPTIEFMVRGDMTGLLVRF